MKHLFCKSIPMLAVIVLLCSACSSTYKVPTTRMLSPESEGQGKWTLQGGFHRPLEVTITTAIASTPVTSSAHPIETRTSLGATGSYGILDRLDAAINIDLAVIPIYLLKYQLMGQNRRAAKSGDFSLAVFGGAGREAHFSEEDQDPLTTSISSIAREPNFTFQTGVLMGFRATDTFLIKLGYSSSWQHMKGTHTISGTPHTFDDQPRYHAIDLGVNLPLPQKNQAMVFVEPHLQQGWLSTFNSHNQPKTLFMIDVGISFQ